MKIDLLKVMMDIRNANVFDRINAKLTVLNVGKRRHKHTNWESCPVKAKTPDDTKWSVTEKEKEVK